MNSPRSPHKWTDEEDREIAAGMDRGETMSVIASRLGHTTNMVIGRSHRLRGMIFPCQLKLKTERQAAAQARTERRLRAAEYVEYRNPA